MAKEQNPEKLVNPAPEEEKKENKKKKGDKE